MSLSIKKKGQGTVARGIAGVVVVLLGLWAAHSTWGTLFGASPAVRGVATGLVAALFVGLPLYLVLFVPRVVDLLIETQQEMRKVAWSSRSEVLGATAVVVVVVALLSVFILLTDFLVFNFNDLIGVY